jgi:hypothetical protein
MDVTPVLPQSDGKIDFDMLDCSISGPEVTIVEDYELQSQPTSCIGLLLKLPSFSFHQYQPNLSL